MTYPPREEYVIYEGPAFTVEWYYTEEGYMPAYEFFKDMDESTQDRFLAMVKYMADSAHGTHLPKTMYNIEDQEHKIYAFKPHGQRFFNFMTAGHKIIVTNAYSKSSQKMTKKDLEKLKISIAYKEDYSGRVARGDYYEKN